MIPGFVLNRALLTLLSFAVPYVMLASRLVSREGAWWRRLVAGILAATFALLTMTQGMFAKSAPTASLQSVIVFTGILVLATLLFLLCCQCTFWVALFCSVFGYTMQNLGSNLLRIASFVYRKLVGPYDELTLSVILVLSVTVACVSCYRLFLRNIPRNGLVEIDHRSLLALVASVIFLNIIADSLIMSMDAGNAGDTTYIVLTIAHAMTCLLALFFEFETLVNSRLKTEAALRTRAFEEREHQYQASRDAIEALNARMHDMRHAVANSLAADVEGGRLSRESLASALHELYVYDAPVRTGNVALDTALSEKRLLCAHEGITLTCVADGSCLAAMSLSDVYALASSLLDDAVADVRGMDKGERSISFSVKRGGGMIHLHVENDAPHESRTASIGVAEGIASQYGGVVTRGISGRVAHANVLVPLE